MVTWRQKRSRLAPSQSTPWWRTPDQLLDGVAPGFILDVMHERYALGGSGGQTLADLVTVANNSAIRRYCDASGAWAVAPANTPRIDFTTLYPRLLLEGASTNLFLGSDTPATQSITVTAQAYTLSCEGSSGSIGLSGAYGGLIIPIGGSGPRGRTSITFTPAAGSLTLTVAGAVEKVQLEAGSAASSYIPTAGAAVTRTADLCQLTAAAAAVLRGTGGAVAIRAVCPTTIPNSLLVGQPSGGSLLSSGGGTPTQVKADGGRYAVRNNVFPGDVGAAMGFGPSGSIASESGSAPVSDPSTLAYPRTAIYLGANTGLIAGQIVRVGQVVGWTLPDRPSSAGIQAQARIAT